MNSIMNTGSYSLTKKKSEQNLKKFLEILNSVSFHHYNLYDLSTISILSKMMLTFLTRKEGSTQ